MWRFEGTVPAPYQIPTVSWASKKTCDISKLNGAEMAWKGSRAWELWAPGEKVCPGGKAGIEDCTSQIPKHKSTRKFRNIESGLQVEGQSWRDALPVWAESLSTGVRAFGITRSVITSWAAVWTETGEAK